MLSSNKYSSAIDALMTATAPHIVIISAVYPPEPVVSARMSHDLANCLTEQGCRVTVICPQPSRPLHADYRAYANAAATIVSQEGGVTVVRLPSFSAPVSGLLLRLRESWSFGSCVCRYLSRELPQKPDVLYANAWPLAAQALIARYASKHDIPLVLQIMDMYPESLLNKLPVMLGSIIAPALTRFDNWIVRQSSSLVVISENMRRVFSDVRGIPAAKMETVNIWQDESLFLPLPEGKDAFVCYTIPSSRFTFLYLGNIGPVAGVDLLIRAFCRASLPSAQLLIVGDGADKPACQQLVSSMGLANVIFISDPDATHVPKLQSMADVCLLPVKRGAAMSSIPSKLAAYMFSAKPVLATVDSESDTARIIRQTNCGWVGEPENEAWLAEKMREVAALPRENLQLLGEYGQHYGLVHFSKTEGVLCLAQLVKAATHTVTRQSK